MTIRPWKIYPDLVPHTMFHKGYWLVTKQETPWYYFFPTNRSFDIPNNPDFYKSLDDSLVDITMLLHSRGIPTTPSCSGHFSTKSYYVDVYSRLEQNANSIRSTGVVLENVETNKTYYYKNKNYELPWDSNTFVNNSMDYQTKGVIGFLDPTKTYSSYLKQNHLVKQDGDVVLIFENSKNADDKKRSWGKLYEDLKQIL